MTDFQNSESTAAFPAVVFFCAELRAAAARRFDAEKSFWSVELNLTEGEATRTLTRTQTRNAYALAS